MSGPQIQPNQSDTSLASSGQSSAEDPSIEAAKPRYFTLLPYSLFGNLVPRLGFFIPYSVSVFCAYQRPTFTTPASHRLELQVGELLHCCFSTSSFSNRVRLIPHSCCQRGSYLTEERKRGSCSGPSTALLAPHPTLGKAHSSFPYLYAVGSPEHAVGPATRLE